jgi:hypothetical protein
MKAMILAAGLGTRMRPLTAHCPNPVALLLQPMLDHLWRSYQDTVYATSSLTCITTLTNSPDGSAMVAVGVCICRCRLNQKFWALLEP